MSSSYIFSFTSVRVLRLFLYPIYFHSKINIWQTLKFLNFLLQIVWCAPGLVTHVVVGVNIDVFNNNRTGGAGAGRMVDLKLEPPILCTQLYDYSWT